MKLSSHPVRPEQQARLETMSRREAEAIAEAYRLRRLWQAAASCLAYNAGRIAKARGKDEARMLEHAMDADHGPFWSGSTDGWIE